MKLPHPILTPLLLGTASLAMVAAPAAGARCTGKHAALMRYAGHDALDPGPSLLETPLLHARLEHLPAALRIHLLRDLDVRGPVDLIGCHLVLSGNAEHQGGAENAIVDVNLYSGAVTLGLLSRRRITVYLDHDPGAGHSYDGAVPAAVRWWAAIASTGFVAAQRTPPGLHLVPAAQ